jgi:hypothetical protein
MGMPDGAGYNTAAAMYARNEGKAAPSSLTTDNYLGSSLHVEGRLHTGTADAVPSGAAAGGGLCDFGFHG